MQNPDPPKETSGFQIQAYRRPKDIHALKLENVSFTGSPRKHPYDEEKIVLVADPYSTNTFYYEFEKSDIAAVEELASVVDTDGSTIPMIRIWVKKGSVAVRSTPFITGDTRTSAH